MDVKGFRKANKDNKKLIELLERVEPASPSKQVNHAESMKKLRKNIPSERRKHW